MQTFNEWMVLKEVASMEDLYARARQAIEADEEVVHDVAANRGQIVDNVKHMNWFLSSVAERLANTYDKYAHLKGEF